MKILTTKKDLNLKFLDANQTWLEYAGFKSLEHAIGEDDTACSWANFVEIYKQHELDALNGKVYGSIQPCKSAQKDFCWFYNYKYPEYGEEGKIIHLNVFAHEITNFQWNHFIYNFQKLNQFNAEQYYLDKPLENNLTKREIEVLFYLLHMLTNKKIALLLEISERTVQTHIEKIKNKFECRTKAQVIEYAFMKGYVKIIPTEVFKNKSPRKILDALKTNKKTSKILIP